MKLLNPYIRLMRLHQPVGIWLLFWPCAWALVLASGQLEIEKLLLFFIGAVLMRGAGCIVNDIADRDIDRQVERTKNRPLASGELKVSQAIMLLLVLLLASLLVAYQLGFMVVMWGALALIPVAIYPFMKRVSWWPQLFLGLVFNWGALMGWAAVRGVIEFPAILLYIGGVFLTLGYDTVYAHQDKIDDARIGVRSTALRLADNTKIFVSIMYALAITCFMLATDNISAVLWLIPAALHCFWQVYSLDIDRPDSAKKVFMANKWLGMLIFLGLFFSKL
ncbi:MAG: 4-hydroxybenzoate octaprenyltransferase [Rickettsiales bacterium]